MGPTDKAKFAHRPTDDQTVESICLRCFRTIGKATLGQELEHAEQIHACLAEDIVVLQGKIGPEPVRGEHQKKDLA